LSRWKQEGLRSCDFLGRGPWGFGRLVKGWLAGHEKLLLVGPVLRGWSPFRPTATSMAFTHGLPYTIWGLLSL